MWLVRHAIRAFNFHRRNKHETKLTVIVLGLAVFSDLYKIDDTLSVLSTLTVIMKSFTALATLATTAVFVNAAPFDHAQWVNPDYTARVSIHESCNATQTIQLEKALDDFERFSHNAQSYLQRAGSEDGLINKYFGTSSNPENQPVAAGIFDNLSNGDKGVCATSYLTGF